MSETMYWMARKRLFGLVTTTYACKDDDLETEMAKGGTVVATVLDARSTGVPREVAEDLNEFAFWLEDQGVDVFA